MKEFADTAIEVVTGAHPSFNIDSSRSSSRELSISPISAIREDISSRRPRMDSRSGESMKDTPSSAKSKIFLL